MASSSEEENGGIGGILGNDENDDASSSADDSNSSASSRTIYLEVTWDQFFSHHLSRIRLNDETLTEFDASDFQWDCEMSREQMQSLTAAMKENTHLEKLGLCCHLGDSDMIIPFLEEVLPSHPSLLKLDLSDNELTSMHAFMIAKALATNTCLTTLDVGCNNSIDHLGIKALMDSASQGGTLTHLDLTQNHIDDEGMRAIGSALAGMNFPLTHLILDNNPISTHGVRSLANGLKANSSLLHLSLDCCFRKNPDDIQVLICDVLPDHRFLKSLDLDNNNLTDVHAEWIAAVLKKNTCLEYIDLPYNSIGDKGACSLAEGLRENSSLLAFPLFSNNVGQKGINAFIAAVQHANYTMEHLTCFSRDCEFGGTYRSKRQILERLLRDNTRAKATYKQLESNQRSITRALWPRALERISGNKPDYIYFILKSSNPMIIQEPKNSRIRLHSEAFLNGDETN